MQFGAPRTMQMCNPLAYFLACFWPKSRAKVHFFRVAALQQVGLQINAKASLTRIIIFFQSYNSYTCKLHKQRQSSD
jgi:hypothetical protein